MDLVTALLLVTQWCGVPVDALTMLKTRQETRKMKRPTLQQLEI
jgi:hypothetical protein